MNRGVLIIVLLVFSVSRAPCQETERNYEVVSTATSCDQLPDTFLDKDQAFKLITAANFRISQNFKIRRQKGLKAGEYYSCDNEVGFLIIWIDEVYEIYKEVPLTEWETLIASNDPEGILIANIRPKYSKL